MTGTFLVGGTQPSVKRTGQENVESNKNVSLLWNTPKSVKEQCLMTHSSAKGGPTHI